MRARPVVLFLMLQFLLTFVTQSRGEELTNLAGTKLSVSTLASALLQEQREHRRGACQEGSNKSGLPQCKKIPKPVSLDQITFDFNSATLTSEAREVLDIVGGALTSEQLRNRSFLVEGHTDAKGSAAYNLALSKRRAESVVRYLTTIAGIDTDRLEAVPMGKSALLYPERPDDPKNRRVVFRGITEQ